MTATVQEVADLMQRRSDLLIYRERVLGEIDDQIKRLTKEIDLKQSEIAKKQRAERFERKRQRNERSERINRRLNR